MRDIKKNWAATDIGSQAGKTVIVTGANSGIGFHTALELARKGADVIVAARDVKRGNDAVTDLRAQAPGAKFAFEQLDLADLKSVRAFAERFLASGRTLDILVNNAGVMALKKKEFTVDGFERQLGTNHFGHFALTGLLLPALRKSSAPRVVTLSSGTAYYGKVKLDNLNSEKSYSPMFTYAQSKLANLLFMRELGRRAPWLLSVASHPGGTNTNLQQHAGFGMRFSMIFLGQPASEGALPSLYAAVGEAKSGEFFGPSKKFQLNGPPREASMPKRALDDEMARPLWEASERATNVRFDFGEDLRKSA